MVVMAHCHPEWFTFVDTHVHDHDDEHHMDEVDDMEGFGLWG